VTNSIEQRAAEMRELAEDEEESPAQAGPTYGYGKDWYSKDGKQIVAQPPAPTLQQKRWDVWAV
jgi:hypothetical protein